jgi:hypothetical protein
VNVQAPQARRKIARSFNRMFEVEIKKSPARGGRNPMFNNPVAAAGAWIVLTFYPQLKLRAILGRRSATWLCGSANLFRRYRISPFLSTANY